MPNHDDLIDREAAIDSLTRFIVSLDRADATLCTSSLASDAEMVLDLAKTTPNNSAITDAEPDTISPRETIVSLSMVHVGRPLDAVYFKTNIYCFATSPDTVEPI